MTILNSEHHLTVLRERLRNRTISVLVGAGFSKNVSEAHFPNWNQLLRKLVISYRGASTLEKFRRQMMDYSIEFDDPEFVKFLDGEVSDYIESTGYLKVVSDYIRHTGIRESIDSFIEENTPTVFRLDNGDALRCFEDGKVNYVKLGPDALDLHRKLVNFPWNNVYTTNYDNLLEYCIDEKISNKIRQRISEIEDNIDTLSARQENLQAELKIIIDEITLEDEQILKSPMPSPLSEETEPDPAFKHKRKKRTDLQWNLENVQREISDLSSSRSQFLRSLDDCYVVISRSSQLSLKKHRNIIKLHGTIDHDDAEFAFDDDVHKRYVISSEDYETYPAKHEAFTQLMRISLLQDYFMLIGFSGDDPNFLAWVSWVRDVIRKGTNSDEYGKIFLIDVGSDGFISRYKSQFYRNHQIVHIPLRSPEVLDFLSKHHGSTLLQSDFRGILSAFLDFLGEVAPYNPSQVAVEKLYRSEYEGYFRNLPVFFDKSTPIDLSSLLNNKPLIENASRYNRLTSIQSPYTFSKVNFINSFEEIVAQYPNELDYLFEATIACLVDLHIPYSSLIEKDSLLNREIEDKLGKYDTCSPQLQWLQVFNSLWFEEINALKDLIIRSNRLTDDVKNHILCLGYLFHFNFPAAQNILNSWNASEHWLTIKAGLQSYADIDAARHLLKKSSNRLVQEDLFGIELKLLLSGFHREKRLQDMYRQLEHDGLRHVHGMIKNLLRDVLPGKQRIEVRGSNKFVSGGSLHFSNVSDERSSLQVFGLLMESGFPLSVANSNLYGFHDIFPAVVVSIRFFPVPVLFYSLQYDDVQFLKRVGQEFAYQEKVDYYHQHILNSLSMAYSSTSTPVRFKQNSLFFLSEFIVAIEPALWENFFVTVWKEAIVNLEALRDSRHASMQFIAKCLPIIQNLALIDQLVTDCLSLINSDVVSGITRCSYYLQLNQQFKKNSKTIRKHLDNNLLTNTINAAQNDHNYLFVLGNLSNLLNKTDIEAVNVLLKDLDFSTLDPSLLEVTTSLLKGANENLRKKFTDSLPGNSALWRTGLSDSHPEVIGPAPFIKLRAIRKQSTWLNFSKIRVHSIYEKLSEELVRISDFMKIEHSIDGLVNFRSILQEMLWFLEDEWKFRRNRATIPAT